MSEADQPAAIAGRFVSARRAATGLDDYPGGYPDTLDQAYAVQDLAIALWRSPVIGWKVGRINPPYTERFGTDRLAGPIFQSTSDPDPEMPVFAEGFAAAEAEFLLRIGAAPPAGQRDFSLAEAAALIDSVHIGIEIASSPLGAINDLGPVAVVSDFGNNNGLVIGPEIAGWQSSEFENWRVSMLIEGAEVGTGAAAAFPDGAIGAARFLFEHAARRGIALGAGHWISSGAVTGVHDVRPGQRIEARFGPGLAVRCTIGVAQPK